MKTKELTKKTLVMLTMIFVIVMNAEGQPKQVVEFQTVMSMHETTYKNFIRGGKYKEAIAPLTTRQGFCKSWTSYSLICRKMTIA